MIGPRYGASQGRWTPLKGSSDFLLLSSPSIKGFSALQSILLMLSRHVLKVKSEAVLNIPNLMTLPVKYHGSYYSSI